VTPLQKQHVHIPFPSAYLYGGPKGSCLPLLSDAGGESNFVRENAEGLLQPLIMGFFSKLLPISLSSSASKSRNPQSRGIATEWG